MAENTANNPKKILIVEDEKPMANALQIKLQASGFYTKTAENGEEALKALKNENFDLVLLDLIMPRLDGFGTLEAMKEKGIKVPVIIASNLGQTNDIERAKNLGAIDYFIKSNISIAEIILKIKRALNIE